MVAVAWVNNNGMDERKIFASAKPLIVIEAAGMVPEICIEVPRFTMIIAKKKSAWFGAKPQASWLIGSRMLKYPIFFNEAGRPGR